MLTSFLIAILRIYQLTLSRVLVALFGPVCRFEPSCSRYAMECLSGHGLLRGSLLSVKRLCKCHPFHPGGYDPPPPPRTRSAKTNAERDGRGDDPDVAPMAPGVFDSDEVGRPERT